MKRRTAARLVPWALYGMLFLRGVAASQGLDVMFVLETSPGTEQAIGLIRPKELKPADRAGVVGFVSTPQVLQPLTGNREDLTEALRRAGTRITAGFGGRPGVLIQSRVALAAAIQHACHEFEPGDTAERKPIVIVFFANEDPALSGRLDSMKLALRESKARLFAIVIQLVSAPQFPARPSTENYPFPTMSAQFLSQVASESGGRIYRRNWSLKEILAEARKP